MWGAGGRCGTVGFIRSRASRAGAWTTGWSACPSGRGAGAEAEGEGGFGSVGVRTLTQPEAVAAVTTAAAAVSRIVVELDVLGTKSLCGVVGVWGE